MDIISVNALIVKKGDQEVKLLNGKKGNLNGDMDGKLFKVALEGGDLLLVDARDLRERAGMLAEVPMLITPEDAEEGMRLLREVNDSFLAHDDYYGKHPVVGALFAKIAEYVKA